MRLCVVRPEDQRRKREARYTMGKKQKAAIILREQLAGLSLAELSAVASGAVEPDARQGCFVR